MSSTYENRDPQTTTCSGDKRGITDAEIHAAVVACKLMRSAGCLPHSNASTFTGHVVDYLLDEWHVGMCNDRWNALRDQINELWPWMRQEPIT